MARIRTIKPEIAKHEALFELEQETRLPMRFAWAVLPTACDREGRFKWRPRVLKTDVLPHDALDFADVLNALLAHGFLVKYRVGAEWYGLIPTFKKHQVINNREMGSVLPGPDEADEVTTEAAITSTREARVVDASSTRLVHAQGEGKGREGKGTGREQERKGLFAREEHARPSEPAAVQKPHPIRDLLAAHERLFESKVGAKPAKATGKDVKIAERVVGRYGLPKALELLELFFASTDEFVQRAGFGLNVFEGQINKLLTMRAPRPKVGPAVVGDAAKYADMRFGQ